MLARTAATVLVVAVATAALSDTSHDWRWQRRLSKGRLTAIGAHPSGDLFAAGHMQRGKHPADTARIDRRTHRRLWTAGRWGDAEQIAVAANGDPVVAGAARADGGDPGTFSVIRRDGERGGLLWRYDLPPAGASARATSLALTPSGDVIAGGVVPDGSRLDDPCVVRLDGGRGDEIWRRCFGADGGRDEPAYVHVEPDGDVVASFTLTRPGMADGRDRHVVRLAVADGTVVWHTVLPGRSPYLGGSGSWPLRNRDGFLILAGFDEDGVPTVIALDPTTGDARWTWTGETRGQIREAAVLPDGDVVVAGASGSGPPVFVARLAGGSGQTRWQQRTDGDVLYLASDGAYALAVSPGGDIWTLTGAQYHRVSWSVAMRFDAATGALVDVFSPGIAAFITV